MSDPKDKESENSTRTNQHTKDPKTLTAGSSTCGAQKAVGAIALKVPKNCQLRQFFGFFFFFAECQVHSAKLKKKPKPCNLKQRLTVLLQDCTVTNTTGVPQTEVKATQQ
jgi:hypothetical protein